MLILIEFSSSLTEFQREFSINFLLFDIMKQLYEELMNLRNSHFDVFTHN